MASIWSCTFSCNITPHVFLTRKKKIQKKKKAGDVSMETLVTEPKQKKKVHFKGTVRKLTIHHVLNTQNGAKSVPHVCVFSFWSYKANK